MKLLHSKERIRKQYFKHLCLHWEILKLIATLQFVRDSMEGDSGFDGSNRWLLRDMMWNEGNVCERESFLLGPI